MTLLYYNERFLEHQTGSHPERPERLTQIMRQLNRTGLDEQCVRPDWQPAADQLLIATHGEKYLHELRDYATNGGGRIEEDTVMSSASFDVAQLAAGAAIDAVQRVLEKGEAKTALALVRPPGHHALVNHAMGFCLLNNVAVAANEALRIGAKRILIVDWDVHHGNGTQDIFWENEQVGFFSIHRWPFYPGTGNADETGSGAGLGTTLNVPVKFGTARDEFLSKFTAKLQDFAERMKPELVLISAGFDAHRDDPVGSLDLEIEDFISLTNIVQQIADTWSAGRIVSLLEGGYNTGVLAGCVEVHLRELLKK